MHEPQALTWLSLSSLVIVFALMQPLSNQLNSRVPVTKVECLAGRYRSRF